MIDPVVDVPTDEPEVIESRVYQERYNDQMFLGLALPADFFERLNLNNNDSITWTKVDQDTYTLNIVRR